jgi:non-lysosomal glucosylceramidase
VVASQLIHAGMVREGVECIAAARARFDGERRNPWDEPECGHHYARAMSAWSGLLALSGFRYDGRAGAVAVLPRASASSFRCFWSTATGWGVFTTSTASGAKLTLDVLAGSLPCSSCEIAGGAGRSAALINGQPVEHRIEQHGSRVVCRFERKVLERGHHLRLEIGA